MEKQTPIGYPFDAAFYDNAFAREGICHCRFCKAKFREETGHALPRNEDLSDPLFRRALQFKYDSFCRGMLRCVEAARSVRPDLAIVFNNVSSYCHWCAAHGEALSEALDYSCTEYVENAGTLKRLGWAHDTIVSRSAYHIAFLRGKSGRNRKVHAYNFVAEPTSQARMDIDLRLELVAAAALGGVPAIQGDQPVVVGHADHITGITHANQNGTARCIGEGAELTPNPGRSRPFELGSEPFTQHDPIGTNVPLFICSDSAIRRRKWQTCQCVRTSA